MEERELTHIIEIENLWRTAASKEIKKHLILSLRTIEGITIEEKLEFLLSISDSAFRKPILEVILDLVPVCTDERSKDYHVRILEYINDSIKMDVKNCMGRIKKFVHSFLNTYGKDEEETRLYGRVPILICRALIQCGMFEELINYNFIDISSIVNLWNHIFIKNTDTNTNFFQYHIVFEWPENCYGGLSHLGLRDISKVSHESKQKIKELLFSWDKVENRHALATLWTLLAKRGDLEKIFKSE